MLSSAQPARVAGLLFKNTAREYPLGPFAPHAGQRVLEHAAAPVREQYAG
jgi:hypothetical protein